jgi:hypothetical protein
MLRKAIILTILLVYLISAVTAIEISGDMKFDKSVQAGQSYSFQPVVRPDSARESIDLIFVKGSCSDFVSANRTSGFGPTTIDINIPQGAVNGISECKVFFHLASKADASVEGGIFIPIRLDISGGIEKSIEVTPEPTLVVTSAPVTPEPTPTPVVERPSVNATPVVERPSVNATPVVERPSVNAVAIIMIGSLMLGIVLGIVAWFIKRPKDEYAKMEFP